MQEMEKQKVLTEAEKVWIACAIDCEGSVELQRNRNGASFTPRVRISNTCKDFVEAAQLILGCGTINTQGNLPNNRKDSHILSFYSNNIRSFLPEVLPYMVIKYPQAHALLEALEILELRKQGGSLSNPFGWYPQGSEESREWLEEIYLKIKKLNKKGKGD